MSLFYFLATNSSGYRSLINTVMDFIVHQTALSQDVHILSQVIYCLIGVARAKRVQVMLCLKSPGFGLDKRQGWQPEGRRGGEFHSLELKYYSLLTTVFLIKTVSMSAFKSQPSSDFPSNHSPSFHTAFQPQVIAAPHSRWGFFIPPNSQVYLCGRSSTALVREIVGRSLRFSRVG